MNESAGFEEKDGDPLGESNPLWTYATGGQTPFGLGDTADLANWIGRVIYGYSAIEFQLFINMACMSHIDSEDSYKAFYKLKSVRHKQTLALSKAACLPIELRRANEILWRRMKGAASRRNEIAHCAITKPEKHPIGLQLLGDKILRFRLDVQRFGKTISQFRILQTDAHMLFVCLRMLAPGLCRKRLNELPVQRDNKYLLPEDYPDRLPQRAEEERIASLKRLGLDSVLFLEQSMYLQPEHYEFRFGGKLVLWVTEP